MNESEYFHIPLRVDLPHAAERVTFSPDGRRLAVGAGWRFFGGNERRGLSVVDADSGEIVWTTADLNCLDMTFTPDAQRLAVSALSHNSDLRILLFQVSDGEKLWEAPAAGFLAFSPDATLLGVDGVSESAGGEPPRSFVLDANSGALLHKQGSSMAVPGFTADSRLMCTGCPSVAEASTGTLRWTGGDHVNVASAAVFTDNDDAVLFASAPDAHILVLQVEAGLDGAPGIRSFVDAPELFNADQWIGAISFSPGRGMILQLGRQDLTLISVTDGSVLHRFPKTKPAINTAAAFRANDRQLALNISVPPAPPDLPGAGISVVDTRTGATLWSDPGLECTDLALSADGARLAAVGETSLLVYELGLPARSRRDCQAPVSALATSAAAAGIVAAAADNSLIVFRAATGEKMLERVHPGTIGAVAVSPDGHSVVTASSDGRCRHFDTLTGDRWIGKHNAPVNAVAFSDDGNRVATASADRTARLFDRTPGANPDDRTALWSHQHPQGVSHVVVGPAAAWLATACLDRKVRILSGSTGDELHSPFEHDGKIRALAVAGTTLVTASDDGSALVIDAVSGQRRFRLEHPGKVTTAAVSSDAALLATAGIGSDCHIWRIDGAQPVLLHRLTARAIVNDLAFGANGQLAIATEHQVVAVVDPGTGREIERLIHPKAVSRLASGIDRGLLATACADNVARVYEMREE
ncbi:WD40 repeat domain-containing protein [Nocardia xishanensis]|uniref:WD40 repeat domain-containing protein n=1 Tax=Nocardia xishanensis TaxID=238964 RepID=UPI00082DC605|nr:WD40 repeat domain-containing protein [Nocardia xishanensis]